MNTMTYKGYTARVEYDERDNIFAGRILGIRSIISFHGETVAELRAEFELAIKDYLADCKEQGVHPDKPASGKLLIRVPPDMHRVASRLTRTCRVVRRIFWCLGGPGRIRLQPSVRRRGPGKPPPSPAG